MIYHAFDMQSMLPKLHPHYCKCNILASFYDMYITQRYNQPTSLSLVLLKRNQQTLFTHLYSFLIQNDELDFLIVEKWDSLFFVKLQR